MGDARVIIGLGSNIGQGRLILQEAWQALGEEEGITVRALASPYLSAPVGMNSRHWFTNSVGILRVSLTPLDLLIRLFAVEKRFGRVRSGGQGYEDRSLDLDLLYYEDMVINDPDLTIPHPRIAERLFVSAPLAELVPDFKDPISGLTMAEMEAGLHGRMAAGEVEKQEIRRDNWGG